MSMMLNEGMSSKQQFQSLEDVDKLLIMRSSGPGQHGASYRVCFLRQALVIPGQNC